MSTGSSASSARAMKAIKYQETARQALLCKKMDVSDAIRFLENDYDRQWNEWNAEAERAPEDKKPAEPRSLGILEGAIEFLKSNRKWDGRVQYELIDPKAGGFM